MKRLLSYLIAVFALLLCGCEFRVIDYNYIDTAEVNIVTDWSRSSLASHPNGQTVMFFPQEDGNPTVKLSHSDTITVNLPLGMYDVIAFNETFEDFDYIEFINTSSFLNIAAVCKTGVTVRSGYEVFEEPDMLAAAVIKDFEVTENMVSETRTITRARAQTRKGAQTRAEAGEPLSENLTWHVQPTPLVYNVRVKVAVEGLDKVNSTGAYISGFAHGVYLADGEPLSAPVTHKLTFNNRSYNTGSTTSGYLTGHFYSFGLVDHGNDPATDYEMDFRAVLPDNSNFQAIRSLRGNIQEFKSELTVTFEIDVGFSSGDDGPIVIPDVAPPDDPGGGGWQVKVGDWTEEVIPIEM